MTRDETSKYAIEAVLRAAIREEFESAEEKLLTTLSKGKDLLKLLFFH
jgi:hypothetical protein